MNNAAIICRIKNVHKHPNADKVQLGTACGYQVVVGLDVSEGDLGIYFPTDTCLGSDFARVNEDLLTYFGKNLRVRTQKFRGEKSEGFWCDIKTLPTSLYNVSITEGTELSTHDNIEICKKYINLATLNARPNMQGIAKRLRSGSYPTFQKHVETEHLRKEINKINLDEPWVLTYKVHGTSQRVGYCNVERDLSWFERAIKKLGVQVNTNHYEYLVGTRNVILGELKPDGSVGNDGFYSDEFRKEAAKPFIGNLHKGEVVYYEVVGYSAYNVPIMGTVSVKDKELKKIYGDNITYTYGCENGQHDIYVYRIAYQTEDGESIDLTWDQVKKRCAELGVKYVPEAPFTYKEWINESRLGMQGEDIFTVIGDIIENSDPNDSSHPCEGVVLRVESSAPKFYKEKSFIFKYLEGIIKDSNQFDIEEAS